MMIEKTNIPISGFMYLARREIILRLLSQLMQRTPGAERVRPHLGQTDSCFSYVLSMPLKASLTAVPFLTVLIKWAAASQRAATEKV